MASFWVCIEQKLKRMGIWSAVLLSKFYHYALKVQSSTSGPQKNFAINDRVPKDVQVQNSKELVESNSIEVEPEESPDEPTLFSADPLTKLANDILDVLERYGQHLSPKEDENSARGWIGKPVFMDKVKKQLEKRQAVHLILPAFPWKSINKIDKVTGVLPDLGEELALARLNQLCEEIREVYPLGGVVHIATDGLVFDDVVGISDDDTWAYGEGLLQLAREKGYEKNIKLMRVMDILGYTEGKTLNKDLYMSLTQKCRTELLASYGRTEEEVRQMMRDDPDTLLTYCGFIRFLETDLRQSTVAQNASSGHKYRKCVKKVAINMMIRAEVSPLTCQANRLIRETLLIGYKSFTKLLQARKPQHVRLSIHPSTGAAKLSIPLIIQGTGDFPKSPWHSSIALALDGSYMTVHSKNVRDTHNLIHKDGRAYYYREKSELWDWEDEDVIFEPQYPNCMLVHPRVGTEGKKYLTEFQLEKLQRLRAVHQGPVKVMGFCNSVTASVDGDC
ncbi:hypothetical protein N7490_010975 [Penicillium lividum]|nr:hypothetical protein N7490_010975 [Penicillium lividum]